ncbi:hypothetical protein MMC26_007591 [Xylographa opegraphella]|nr:hypothetical protein [Xylographa opegraphella]
MASIFKEAAADLRSCCVPVTQRPTVSPSFQRISSRHGPKVTVGKKLLVSGYTTPIVHVPNPDTTPVVAVYQDSDEDDCHSTHGVPYIIAPRVAFRTSPRPNPNIDGWLDELVGPTMGSSSVPPTKSSNVTALSATVTCHVTSSPTPHIATKRMGGTKTLKSIPCPAPTSATAVQAPLNLNSMPRRPESLDIPGSSHCCQSSIWNSSNKENHVPPTVASFWSSVPSSPPREHCVDECQPQSSAASLPGTLGDKVDAMSHPTFSTPSTLCSPDHCKKLQWADNSPPNISQIAESRSTAKVATHLAEEDGLLAAILFLGKDVIVEGDVNSTVDSSEEVDVLPLSPGVEKYRKGRAPRRERCASYWDSDMVPELSPNRAAVVLQQ